MKLLIERCGWICLLLLLRGELIGRRLSIEEMQLLLLLVLPLLLQLRKLRHLLWKTHE